jgi:hypothetical protein
MTCNLLLWRWSAEYDTPAKREKKAIKFSDITSSFPKTEDHQQSAQGRRYYHDQ